MYAFLLLNEAEESQKQAVILSGQNDVFSFNRKDVNEVMSNSLFSKKDKPISEPVEVKKENLSQASTPNELFSSIKERVDSLLSDSKPQHSPFKPTKEDVKENEEKRRESDSIFSNN